MKYSIKHAVPLIDADITVSCGGDAIQAETAVTMSGGNYTITSGGGSGVRHSDDASAKGIRRL